jgi:hypothetical protein
MFMALCLWNWRNTEEGDPLTEPQKHIPGLRSDLELVHVFGQDRILGTLVTHVLHPQRREHVRVPHSDPRILVSVKTTTAYHRQRLSLLLFTWMESVSPQQLYIITEKGANDVWIKEAELSGIHVVKSHCPAGHAMDSLCCKSGQEFEEYYRAIETGESFRWFCHFDDDEYLNIGSLSKQLETYNSSKDYYVGHWLTKLGKEPQTLGNFKDFPEAKRTHYFYATGASYCISAGLMKKVEKYFRGISFVLTCHKIALTDDFTLGAIIGGVLGIDLTEVSTMLSQGEDFTRYNTSELRNMITISSKEHLHNRIKIPDSPFSDAEDPTGFLSYHCLLYPQVTWCHNPTLHDYRPFTHH